MNIGRIAIQAVVDSTGITDGVRTSEQAMGRLASTAKALGGILAGAFAAQKIGAFMQDAVATAMEAERVWNGLSGTLSTVGVDFASVQGEIEGAARALQDITTVGDEDFAGILQTLTTITRDYGASLNEVETVANLAAGAQIDLNTASKLVGRAMIGDTAALKRYGIVVEEGADAMAVLRAQFAGMAENEANTMAGRLAQLSNEWGDLKEAIGNALIDMGGGTSVMELMIGAVKGLTEWISRNREGIAQWSSAGIKVATVSARALYGAVVSLGSGVVGLGSAIISSAVRPFAILLQALASASGGVEKFWGVIGNDRAQARVAAQTATLQRYADNLKNIADVSAGVARASFDAMRDPFGKAADSAEAAGETIRRKVVAPIAAATSNAKELAAQAEAVAKAFKGVTMPTAGLAGAGRAAPAMAAAVAVAPPPEFTAAMEASLRTFEDLAYEGRELAVGWRQVQQQFTQPADTMEAATQMVSGSLLGVAQQFTPMGLLARVVAGALERLGPTIEMLLEPVTMVGELIGALLQPALEAMVPVVRFVAKILSYFGTAIGWLVRGIGKVIDKIPGISGKALIRAGQHMMDSAEQMRKNLEDTKLPDAADKAAASLDKLSESVVNTVQGFKIAAYRHAAIVPGTSPAGGSSGTAAGPAQQPSAREPVAVGGVEVNITTSGDGRETYRNFYRELDERTRAVGGAARDLFYALPRPV